MRALSTLLLASLVFAGCDCGDSTDVTDVTDLPGTDMATGTDGGGSDMSMPPGDGGAADLGAIADMLPDGSVVLDGGGVCFPASCQGTIHACGNCEDDDGDGLIDAEDPNCLGPCDNNEEGLYHELPGGDTPNCKLDCYYDQDQGSGNDGCSFDARCDPQSPDVIPNCVYDPTPPPSANCGDLQSEACIDFCQPLTPNGCDCFGCCLIGGNTVFVGTYDPATDTHTCTLEAALAGDLDACHLCTQQMDCFNDCGRCELCLGKGPEDLPADCFPPPPTDMGTEDMGPLPDGATPSDMFTPDPRCPDGKQPCGLDGDPICPSGLFCLTGCCTLFG